MKLKSSDYHRLLGVELAAEILVVLAVILIFRFISSRPIAACYAGSLFVLLGATLFVNTWRTAQPLKQFLFWASALFLFGVATPMMIVRLAHWGEDFASLYVWGLPAPVFHQYSNTAYFLLVIATVIDRFRLRATH